MKRQGMQTRCLKRFRACPKAEIDSKVAENLLDRQFNPSEPNRYWYGDITYVRTSEGWRYLAVWMDLYSRRIVGWKLGSSMEAKLAKEALNRALVLRKINLDQLSIHTDQGSQYTGVKYQELLKTNEISHSMSDKGDYWDNAAMKSLFSTYKLENDLGDNSKTLLTPWELKRETTYWIEGCCNRESSHSSINHLSPIEYEERTRIECTIYEMAA